MIDSILFWNQVALDAGKTDYSTPDPATPPAPQQAGPTRAARALAITHLAMYDAYVGVKGGGNTYLGYPGPGAGTNDAQAAQAAVSAAACLSLIALYDRQKDSFLKQHTSFLAMLDGQDAQLSKGLAWGERVAAAILADRRNDGSDAPDTMYAPGTQPYSHRVDPLNPGQGFLAPRWGEVKPFGFSDLRGPNGITPLPDPRTLPAYAGDYIQVRDLGRDQGGGRSDEQTTTGLFWAYDGARNIGVPPRLYNQVVRAIVAKAGNVSEATNAKLFAIVNLALADAGIQAWHEKYRHNLWRPILGIRESDAGWGPTGLGDGLSDTQGDPYWQPLGAPRTNSSGPALTPNFPAYPSGHATFGTAALRVTQAVLGLPDSFKFDFVSDEFNGENVGGRGVRSRLVRTMTVAEAIEQNILSRVYLGVHWLLDGRRGAEIGQQIAAKVVAVFPARVA